jgi:hypothetical protein
MEVSKGNQHAIWGFFLIGLGLLFLAERILVLPGWWEDFHWWGLISVLFGLVMTFLARTADDLGTGVTITLFGVWFVLASNDFYGLTWKNSWPLALVAAGVGTVTRGIAAQWMPDKQETKKERRNA